MSQQLEAAQERLAANDPCAALQVTPQTYNMQVKSSSVASLAALEAELQASLSSVTFAL